MSDQEICQNSHRKDCSHSWSTMIYGSGSSNKKNFGVQNDAILKLLESWLLFLLLKTMFNTTPWSKSLLLLYCRFVSIGLLRGGSGSWTSKWCKSETTGLQTLTALFWASMSPCNSSVHGIPALSTQVPCGSEYTTNLPTHSISTGNGMVNLEKN